MSKRVIGDPSQFVVWNGRRPEANFTQPPKIITRPGQQHSDKTRRLTLRESGLWTILMSYDYGGGQIFVSNKTLAQDAGVGEREVRKIRASMKTKGYLDWEPQAGDTNLYILKAPDLQIYDGKDGPETPVSNTPLVSNPELDKTLDNPGPIGPEGRTKSSGVDRTKSSGGGRTKSSAEEYFSEEHLLKEHLLKETTPLTPQGGNGGVSLSPYKQQPDEPAQELLAYFTDQYDAEFGLTYVTRKGTKDLNEFKALLQDLHPNDIKACIDEFMADDDPTLNRKKSVAMFRARINTYMQPEEEW
jgi:hypothetical protein